MKRALPFAVLTVPALLAFAGLVVLCGCDNDTSNVVDRPGGDVPVTDKTCLGCHSSQEELLAALDDTLESDLVVSNFSIYDKSDG